MTPHINAKENEIAPIVLMPGDPKRAKLIADTYLENVKLVSDVRNIYIYTGTYKNKQVSVAASGMGMPSMAIYSYELFKEYNVEKIIRIGTCKTLKEEIKLEDIILATSALTLSNFAYSYDGEEKYEETSNEKLNKKVEQTAIELNKKLHKGPVTTSDVFYHNFEDINEQKSLGLEMESFALFYLAKKLNKQATSILTISDSDFESKRLTSEEREQNLKNTIILGLESIIK